MQDIRFLQEEIFTDVTEGEKHRIDLLVETKLKEEDGLIVIHVESQAQNQRIFNERMFVYFSRLYEKYRRKILPIAVFSHDALRKEPDHFLMNFPFMKVLDFHYLTVQLKKENWRSYERRGREQGKREGIEEGRQEATRLVAKRMKEKGKSVEEIAEITGLGTAEIEKL